MCRKLIQVYACGHTKTICTTACPHAIDTGRKVPREDSANSLSRSASILSTMDTTVKHRGQTPAQSRSPPTSPVSITSRQAPSILLPGQPQSCLVQCVPSTTSSAPSYESSASPSLTYLPFRPTKDAEIEFGPNFCAYYFPHNLAQSNHPCVDCVVLPEWEHRVKRWMTWYKADHPLEKEENVELLSGVEGLKRKAREGKLNVFDEGDGGVEEGRDGERFRQGFGM